MPQSNSVPHNITGTHESISILLTSYPETVGSNTNQNAPTTNNTTEATSNTCEINFFIMLNVLINNTGDFPRSMGAGGDLVCYFTHSLLLS